MGNKSSKVSDAQTPRASLTTEEKAQEQAKQAQVALMKEALAKTAEEHHERLMATKAKEDPHLAVFKEEMLKVVDEHMKEHLKMEAEQNYLKIFKDELMQKVDDHMEELHKGDVKRRESALLKDELMFWVNEHAERVGLATEAS